VTGRTPGVDLGPRELRRLADGVSSEPYERFLLAPLTGQIGAGIMGIDLTAELSGEVVADLRRALLEWKVLVFPGQPHPDASDAALLAPVALGRHWGELESHEGPTPEWPTEIVRLDRRGGYENGWHSDSSWHESPPAGVVLRSVAIPPAGGDTLFADAGAAYDGLPDDVQVLVQGLAAEHDFLTSFGRSMDETEREEAARDRPPVTHPIVRAHPDTGRPILYVNEIFTTRIVDLEPLGDDLLALLCAQLRVPEYQYRHCWEPGDIVLFDNRAVQHYAAADYGFERRVMDRVAITGGPPVAWPG
jgi:taurine dioxygenase